MGLGEINRRIEAWGGEHPIQFALVIAVAMGVAQLIINAVFDRPFYWPSFLIWTLVFPILAAAITRHRLNSGKTSP